MDSGTSANKLRERIERIVRKLVEQYQWQLLSVAELTERVFERMRHKLDASDAEIEKETKRIYASVLEAVLKRSQIARGDETAGDIERSKAGEDLFNYIYRLTYKKCAGRKPDFVEEVTQNACLLVLKNLDKLKEAEALFTFATWQILDALKQKLRKENRKKRLKKDLEQEAERQRKGGISQRHDAFVGNTDLFAANTELNMVLFEAIHKLTSREQAVIIGRYIEGKSDKQLANELKITEGNVRIIRYRALKKLRNAPELRNFWQEMTTGL